MNENGKTGIAGKTAAGICVAAEEAAEVMNAARSWVRYWDMRIQCLRSHTGAKAEF